MKILEWSGLVLAGAIAILAHSAHAADEIGLRFKPQGAQGELRLHSRLGLPVSAMYPEYTIQCSTNLQDWFTVAGPLNGSVGVSDEELRVAVPLQGDHAVYRVMANVKLAADGGGGEAVYGYGTEFSKELQRLGQLPLDEFVRLYSLTNQYLPSISFDPTTAEFWNLFSTNANFQLDAQEFAVFQTNGFVVSQRLGTYSFADSFYDIFEADLPVYFSADAALHAWHFTYQQILEELEETSLSLLLQGIIAGMQDRIPALWAEAANTAVTNGVLDADYFLAVARSLATATTNTGHLGQSSRIRLTLLDIGELATKKVSLFGTNRLVDFSQFRVRGHYERSALLTNYFRAMMWCGFMDFRFTGSTNDNSLRELSGAVALSWLLDRSGQYSNWGQFNRTIEMFVGVPDSLNFAQLGALLTSSGIQSPTNLANHAALEDLQAQLMSGQLGFQSVLGGAYIAPPFATQPMKLPRSFGVMGQRFVLDSWCLSKCVYDRIVWDQDGIPSPDDLILRRVPSSLDVAFGVFGNDHIVPEIAARIARTNLTISDGRAFWRDGHPYQHNLAAVRNVIDKQDSSAWTNSIYAHWLACLRELSVPTTGVAYPEAMRTRPWAMKDLNTQLASWTELRHDTVLYVKQSYTPGYLCSYPDGYVEPRPAFWNRMHQMALATRGLLATLSTNGVFTYKHYDSNNRLVDVVVTGEMMRARRLAVMDQFLNSTATLQAIAEKELAKTPLSQNEKSFLQHLVEFDYVTGARNYSGYYFSLFYRPGSQYIPPDPITWDLPSNLGQGADYWDALVTDVHTDMLDIRGDPGSVLHEGVGNVHLLTLAVDCGPGDRAVYAGPVMSHYEFELGPDKRMTDSEWKTAIRTNGLPPQPEWTKGFLVPGPYVPPPSGM